MYFNQLKIDSFHGNDLENELHNKKLSDADFKITFEFLGGGFNNFKR